jgi:hypothetical protein
LSRRVPRVPPLPDNPGVEILYRVSESLTRMSADEMFALSVRTGIYTADGRLTRKYGGTADPEEVAAA